ncbi:MAG: hypothetical protein ACKVOR_01435 [Flavobacteriales bacterium]
MDDFTLDLLLKFTQTEEQIVATMLEPNVTANLQPSSASVSSILAYSKALSVRKSKKIKQFRLVLN